MCIRLTVSNLLYAALGGFIFNIANVLLMAGIEIVGLAIAFPISIGIALVEGVVLSYALQPRAMRCCCGAGVLMAVVAVVLVGKSYGALRSGRRAVSRQGRVGVRDFGIADGDLRAVCDEGDDAGQYADSVYDGGVSDAGRVCVLLLCSTRF